MIPVLVAPSEASSEGNLYILWALETLPSTVLFGCGGCFPFPCRRMNISVIQAILPAFLGTSVQEVALMAIELLDSFLHCVLRGTSSIRLRAGDDWTDKTTLTFLC